MRRCLLLLPVLLAGLSCERADEAPAALPARGEGITVRLACAAEEPPVRSSFAPADPDRIYSLNVWVYRDGCLFPDYSSYTGDFSGNEVSLLFPDLNGLYDVYFLANMGEMEAPVLEEDIGEVSFTVTGHSAFVDGGFPMAAALLDYRPEEGTVLQLEKLVGRYDIYVYRNPANAKASYTFTSGKMRCCVGTVRPFAEDEGEGHFASRAMSTSDLLWKGDNLSADDIEALNAGEPVTLYYLENCQGNLLPMNTDPRGKNPEAVAEATGDPLRANLCSYLEFTCRVTTPTVTYPSVLYRMFLGRDMTGDFSVVRGTCSRLMLDVVSDCVTGGDWFVVPGERQVTGKILLTESDPFGELTSANAAALFDSKDVAPTDGIVSDPSFYLQSNLRKIYYVYCSDPAMDYTVTPSVPSSVSPYVSYTLEPMTVTYTKNGQTVTLTSVYWKKLTVSTSLGPEAFGGVFDSAAALASMEKAMTMDISSYDGVINVPLRVGVIGKLKAEFSLNSSKLLEISMFDPIGYRLDSGKIGTEAFAAGSHYYWEKFFLSYDSPFWCTFLKTSSIDLRTRNDATMMSVFTETPVALNASSDHNTMYNTMLIAESYKLKNKRTSTEYAYADMVYARVNTMDFMLGCPTGYSFVSAGRNIPVEFGSSLGIFSGNDFFGTGACTVQGLRYSAEYASGTKYAAWEGIYVLNGKLLDYSQGKETIAMFFEKDIGGRTYTMTMDDVYSFTSGHGTAYRNSSLARYDGLLVYGSGTHTAAWWSSFPGTQDGFYKQFD